MKSAAAGRILGALWLRPLCFIEAIFQCLHWQHLRLLNCSLQGKTERETKQEERKKREGARDHGRRKERLERERERLTIARRQVARSPLAADEVNFLWFVCLLPALSGVIYISECVRVPYCIQKMAISFLSVVILGSNEDNPEKTRLCPLNDLETDPSRVTIFTEVDGKATVGTFGWRVGSTHITNNWSGAVLSHSLVSWCLECSPVRGWGWVMFTWASQVLLK